jgi:hypothetical protein
MKEIDAVLLSLGSIMAHQKEGLKDLLLPEGFQPLPVVFGNPRRGLHLGGGILADQKIHFVPLLRPPKGKASVPGTRGTF